MKEKNLRTQGEVLALSKDAQTAFLEDGGQYYLDIRCPFKDEKYLEAICKALPDLKNWKVEMANRISFEDNAIARVYFVLHKKENE